MPTSTFNRRALVGGSALGAASVLVPGSHSVLGQPATPGASPVAGATPVAGSQEFLAVADPESRLLHVYSLPGLALIDTVEDVAVNAHVGFIPLPNGQLLFMDDAAAQLMAIEVHGDHVDSYQAAIPGASYSHIAIESDRARYAAIGSDDPASPITLVDLETWDTMPVAVEEPGEVGLMLTHDTLFHRNDVLNQIEAYALDDVLAGKVTMTASVQIGAGGHGESITLSGDTLYTATDDGIDAVAWDGSELTYLTTYPWDSGDRTGGRGYFQRLSLDGSQVISYTADRSAAETEWDSWTNDAVLIDSSEGGTRRIELGDGYVFRFGLSHDAALFYRMGGDGDEAIVLDLASGDVSQRIPLDPMTTGPAAGDAIYEINQYRAVAASTDGAWGFITQGGDGVVVVLDLTIGEVAGTIEVGTPLNGGGYLAVFGADASFTDSIGR